MINLKITMNSGKEFHVRNFAVDNVRDWIRVAFMPQGVQILWFEIIPKNFIQVSQIQEIKELTDQEVEDLNKPEIVEQEEEPNPKDQEVPESERNEE